MAKRELPAWVLKWKEPGTTVKCISGSYYLYKATSKRVAGKPWPVSVQTYVGRITEQGIVEAGYRIEPSLTRAALLEDLVADVPNGLGEEIFLLIDGRWHLTCVPEDVKSSLERMGMVRDGVLLQQGEGDA